MDCDVFISGGGIAGLTASAAFAASGFSVICVDPTAPATEPQADGADLRTTAILSPGRALLEDVGVWSRLAPQASALETMRIINLDETGHAAQPKDFRAQDIQQEAFGWNLPNWFLRRELRAHLEHLPNARFEPGLSATAYLGRSDAARVRLSDGRTIRTRLALAADGRNSTLRQAAGIPVKTMRYGQKALVFAVRHALPHGNVSTELHRSGGPFTLVPLPDVEGQPCSAVVWMDDGPLQAARETAADEAFNDMITERSAHVLGPLTCVTKRSLWPIISQYATRLTASRLAVIAEAAHVVPPIGAQGLNMSLKDIAQLVDLARAAPQDLGSPQMLQQYESRRLPDIRLRVAGIDMLNRASQIGIPGLQRARGLMLDTLHGLPPLRNGLMQLGLGLRD